ncbi:MAG: heme lyase CcmF/NrfE family subunit, partial [Candidatus Puniceispirillaceae bacterium]
MINQFGSFSLYFSLLCSSYLIYKSFISQNTINKRLSENVFSVLSVQLVLTLISFFSLIYAFVISDFSNITVYNNSHTLKPLFYKISGAWGNHEGSLLL